MSSIFETNGAFQIAVFCVVGILSILGSLVCLYCYFFLQPVRSNTRKLLVFIAFTEAISIFGNVSGMIFMKVDNDFYKDYVNYSNGNCSLTLPSDVTTPQFCQIQAFITNFFSMSSFFYNAGLAVMMCHITITTESSTTLYWLINILAWVVPTAITVSVASRGYYGYSPCTTGGWCWLAPIGHDDIVWMTIAGKLWELLAESVMLISYILLRVILKYKQRQCTKMGVSQEVVHTLKAVESLYFRLVLTPVLFFFCYIFGTFRAYFLKLYGGTETLSDGFLDFLAFIHGFGNNAPGICNFVVFVLMHKTMRTQLKTEILTVLRRMKMDIIFVLCCCRSFQRDDSIYRTSLDQQPPIVRKDNRRSYGALSTHSDGIQSVRSYDIITGADVTDVRGSQVDNEQRSTINGDTSPEEKPTTSAEVSVLDRAQSLTHEEREMLIMGVKGGETSTSNISLYHTQPEG